MSTESTTDTTDTTMTAEPTEITNPKPRGTVLLRMAGPVAIYVDRKSGAFCTNVNGALQFWESVEAIDAYGLSLHAGPWVPAFHIMAGTDLSAIVRVDVTPIDKAGSLWLERKGGKTISRRNLIAVNPETLAEFEFLQGRAEALFAEQQSLRAAVDRFKFHSPKPTPPPTLPTLDGERPEALHQDAEREILPFDAGEERAA